MPKSTSTDARDHGAGPTDKAEDTELQSIARHLTDVGNSARFAIKQRQRLRFCYGWGKWLWWNGKQWQVDECGKATSLAKETVLGIYAEASAELDDGRRNALVAHAKTSQKRDCINAMMDLAKPDLAIRPTELDSDPWLLNCQNGTINLRTGTLQPHRREDCCSKICHTGYNADCSTLIYTTFLNRIFQTYPAGNRHAKGAQSDGPFRSEPAHFCEFSCKLRTLDHKSLSIRSGTPSNLA